MKKILKIIRVSSSDSSPSEKPDESEKSDDSEMDDFIESEGDQTNDSNASYNPNSSDEGEPIPVKKTPPRKRKTKQTHHYVPKNLGKLMFKDVPKHEIQSVFDEKDPYFDEGFVDNGTSEDDDDVSDDDDDNDASDDDDDKKNASDGSSSDDNSNDKIFKKVGNGSNSSPVWKKTNSKKSKPHFEIVEEPISKKFNPLVKKSKPKAAAPPPNIIPIFIDSEDEFFEIPKQILPNPPAKKGILEFIKKPKAEKQNELPPEHGKEIELKNLHDLSFLD